MLNRLGRVRLAIMNIAMPRAVHRPSDPRVTRKEGRGVIMRISWRVSVAPLHELCPLAVASWPGQASLVVVSDIRVAAIVAVDRKGVVGVGGVPVFCGVVARYPEEPLEGRAVGLLGGIQILVHPGFD